MVPISGSAYTYSYATLGELVAWIIGWDLIIEYAVGNVAVAISWGNYFKTFVGGFGLHIPDWLSTDYRTASRIPGLFESAPHIFGIPIVVNVLAIGIVAIITFVLVVGIRESARMNSAMVVLKLIVLGLFVVVGWGYMKTENWVPFAPNGWAGVQAGAAIVFFAYIGFDAVSTVAEETKNPKRDLPIGIIGSLIICTAIYVVVAMVFTGIIPYSALVQKLATEQAEPLTMALQYANIERWGNVFVGIVAFGSVVAHTAVLLVFQLGQPRIFFSMARDGLLPQSFARVHPRYKTPHVTTILTGVAVGVCAMFTSIDEMVDLTNIGTLFAFVLVSVGILILRKREPDHPRAFRTPWVPFLPIAGILACLYLMMGLPWITWIRFGLWLALGLVIYFLYGYRRSRLARSG
jgi:APA family basic amino acid/polyamine antiporter